jgi:hypothetical protein
VVAKSTYPAAAIGPTAWAGLGTSPLGMAVLARFSALVRTSLTRRSRVQAGEQAERPPAQCTLVAQYWRESSRGAGPRENLAKWQNGRMTAAQEII